MIDLYKAASDAERDEVEQLTKRISNYREQQGFRLLDTRALEIAGVRLQCREQYDDNFRGYGSAYVIYCHGPGSLLSASYEGSAALVSDFYSIGRTVRAGRR
jgi:hypothetical protein